MISLLVAYTKNNRVIGAQGVIPWNTNFERRRFKQICNGKKVLMGHNTFKEIGHALPYCTIVIVSKEMKTAPQGCELLNTINPKELAKKDEEILVAGGGQLYRQFLPYATKIYATEILKDYEGNVTFPELNDSWIETERVHITDDLILYDYVTFTLQTAYPQ